MDGGEIIPECCLLNWHNDAISMLFGIDVLYSKRYNRAYIPRQKKQPKEEYRVVVHPDKESALKAAKMAVKQKRDRYFGRASDGGIYQLRSMHNARI